MSQIDLSDSNYEISESFVRAIFSSPDPKKAAARIIQAIFDHPFLDGEMHDSLVKVAARCLKLSVVPEGRH